MLQLLHLYPLVLRHNSLGPLLTKRTGRPSKDENSVPKSRQLCALGSALARKTEIHYASNQNSKS